MHTQCALSRATSKARVAITTTLGVDVRFIKHPPARQTAQGTDPACAAHELPQVACPGDLPLRIAGRPHVATSDGPGYANLIPGTWQLPMAACGTFCQATGRSVSLRWLACRPLVKRLSARRSLQRHNDTENEAAQG